MLFSFDDFELDEELYQLRRDGLAIPLEPKPFDVLCHLVERRGQVVSRDDLLEAVWPNEHVTESVLHRCVSLVRKALDDDEAKSLVATVRGRGYRFTADVARAPANERAAGQRVPVEELFLGRDPIIDELRACWEEADSGRGRIVLLTGEPGIGKTRIVDEFIGQLHAPALSGRCVEGDGAPPYWPWVQVIRRAIDLGAGASARSLLDRFEGASEDEGDDRLRRFRLFDDLGRVLATLSDEAPLVVALEDLHWADAPSLLLLQNLAATTADRRLLIVATLRDERRPRDDPFARMRGELARLGHVRRIGLEGLDGEQVARFLALTLGREAPAPLLDAVLQRTEGNPLFLREVVNWILTQPHIHIADLVGRWHLELPGGVRDVIERRVGDLGEETARVLEAAAVLGREFEGALLAEVRGGTRDEIDEALERACAARVIERGRGERDAYVFSHALIRETLFEGLPAGVRTALHVQAAEALETRHQSNTTVVLSELAHHFFEAYPLGGAERTLRYVEAAAAAATQRLAWEEAAVQLERAATLLERAEPPEPARRLAALRGLGEAWSAVGDVREMRAGYQRAAELALSMGQKETYAEMVLGAMGSEHWGPVSYTLGKESLERALAGVPDEPSDLRVSLLSRLAAHNWQWTETDVALAQSERALEMARTLGEPEALIKALTGRGAALHARVSEPGGPEAYAAIVDEVIALTSVDDSKPASFTEVGDLRQWRASLALLHGDAAAFRRDLEGCIATAERGRQPTDVWLAFHLEAALALFDARLDDANEALGEAFRTGQRFGLPWAGMAFLAGALELARCRTDVSAAASSWDSFAANYETPSELLRALELSLLSECGRAEEVRAPFVAWLSDGFDRIPRHHEWIPVMCGLAETAYGLRHTEGAEVLYGLLSPHALEHSLFWGTPIYQGPVHLRLSRLALVLDRRDEAIAHADAAVADVVRMGARAWEVHARMQAAEAHAAVAHTERAAREDERARELAAEVGMGAAVDRMTDLQHASGFRDAATA